MNKLVRCLALLLTIFGSSHSVADEGSYFPCRSCHGDDGWGSPAIHAPAIAGQSTEYLQRQLTHYRDGARGSHSNDTYGKQMALMAQNLDEEGIQKLAIFIAAMAPWPQADSAAATDNSAIYQPCVVCHGSRGDGNQALKAPRISSQDTVYLSTQLRNFRDGVRGGDALGQQMRAAAITLTNDEIEQLAQLISSM